MTIAETTPLALITDIRRPLLTAARELSQRYEAVTRTDERKSRGQFFTPPSIAAFMAGQIRDLPDSMRILDAGAGTGMLIAAVCDRILTLGGRRQVHAMVYENHAQVLPFLDRTLESCKEALAAAGHDFSYSIRDTDFILENQDAIRSQTQRSFFTAEDTQAFDIALLNPPYYKLNRDAPQVAVMDPIVHGQPNIYALFMAMAAALLRDGGQLIAITPRSFCNGLYFRGFRRWFFKRMQPRAIHLFGSRSDAFQENSVLQENVILTCDRLDQPPPAVTITRSKGRDLSGQLDECTVPFAQIVNDTHDQMIIRIPEARLDSEIMAIVDSWPCTFGGLGFAISTGPVVSFRARHLLVDTLNPEGPAAPMLWMHNVKPFRVTWPLIARGKAQRIERSERTTSLLLPTKNYVIVKRFSAKEERRRMTAGVLLADDFPGIQVGIENHLNYIYRANGELTPDEALGIAGLFNSALIDRFFRTMSGNTQVNATEIRTMPMPSLARIRAIGQELRREPRREERTVEEIVLAHLSINGSIASRLLEKCR